MVEHWSADPGITGVLGQAWRGVRDTAGARWCRGTARLCSTGTSQPTTGGTHRRRRRPCGRSAVRSTGLRDADAGARRRRRAASVVGGRRGRLDGRRGHQRLTAPVRVSRSPVADLLTSRPPADVPIEGIELPAGSVVLPVGHRATVTVGLPAHEDGAGLPRSRPRCGRRGAAAGCRRPTGRAGSCFPTPRSSTPSWRPAAICCWAGLPDRDEDPAGFLLSAADLVRLGELDQAAAAALADDVAFAAERIARQRGLGRRRRPRRAPPSCSPRPASGAPSRDLARITARRQPAALPATPTDGIRAVAAVERRLARGAALFPDGIPAAWRGSHVEAHGLAVGPATRLSFAVRWHGERPGGAVGARRRVRRAERPRRGPVLADERAVGRGAVARPADAARCLT